MKIIICVDKENGMLFMGKRQSQDSMLRNKILKIVGGSKLWVSKYTAGQFEAKEVLTIDNDYISKAEAEDYCFVEDMGYDISKTDEVILCRWNRSYPGETYFETDLKTSGFKKKKTENIIGSSHRKITIETYRRG